MKTDDAPKIELDKNELLNRYSVIARLPLLPGAVLELPFQALGWKEFEALIFRVLCQEFGSDSCVPYGYPGQDQEGLDILVTRGDGKSLIYQCKRVQRFTGSEFRSEYKLFRGGSWYDQAAGYYLVSSDYLQDTSFLKAFQEIKSQEAEKLTLSKMGANDLNERLRALPQLVFDFFGEAYVRHFCTEPELGEFMARRKPQPLFPEYAAPKTYIPRKLTRSGTLQQAEENREVALIDVVVGHLESGKQVSLLIRSNAAYGKTTELLHLVCEMRESFPAVLPLLVRLKHYIPEKHSLSEYLSEHYPSWSNYQMAGILLVLDGIDEIPINGFSRFTRDICSFLNQFPTVHLVMTLRTNFHNTGFVERISERRKFEEFSLEELSKPEIESFALGSLGADERVNDFFTLVKAKSLDDLLSVPFYLVNLLELFREGTSGFPKGRREAMDAIIRRRCVDDAARYDLIVGPADLLRMIKELAVVLTLKGLNAIYCSELKSKTSFGVEDFKRSSLLQLESEIFDQRISFIHANFQEYLFALSLMDVTGEQLNEVLFSRFDNNRLKSKFLNVTNYLFSMMDRNDLRFSSLYQKLFEHNFESLALFEKDKISLADRLAIFDKIISKYQGLEFYFLRDNLVSPEKLWEFVNYSAMALEKLMNCVHTGNDSSSAAFLDLLKSFPAKHLNATNKAKVHVLLLEVIRSDYDYAIHDRAIDLLVLFQIFDSDTLVSIQACPTIHFKMVRAAVFDYIVAWGKEKEYMDYLLESAPVFRDKTDRVAAGLESKYVRTLWQIMDQNNYRKIMNYLISGGQAGLDSFVSAGYSAGLAAKFYARLGEIYLLGPEYHDSETLLLDFYMLAESRKREKLGSLIAFYQACDRVLEGITELLNRGINAVYAFAWIAAVDYDFLVLLLNKYALNEVDIALMLQVRLGLGRTGQVVWQEAFQNLLTKLFPGEFEYAEEDKSWETFPILKRSHDYLILADQSLFLKKALQVFDFITGKTGKSELSLIDLMNFQHSERSDIREVCDTDLVFDALRKSKFHGKREELLEMIEAKDWEEFVFDTVTSWLYYEANPPIPDHLKAIAAGYYEKAYRPHLNFETAISQKAGSESWKVSHASMIYTLFVRQDVLKPGSEELKEMLLLDYTGHYERDEEQSHILHKGPITKLVYDRMDNPDLFSQTVLDHITSDRIKSDMVMQSFVANVRIYNVPIPETLLVEIFNDPKWSDRTKDELLKTYLHLEADLAALLPLMHGIFCIDTEWKWELLKHMEKYQETEGAYISLMGDGFPDSLTSLYGWQAERVLYGLRFGSKTVLKWFFLSFDSAAKLDCSEKEVSDWVEAIFAGCADPLILENRLFVLLEKEMLSTSDRSFCRKQDLVHRLLRKLMLADYKSFSRIVAGYEGLIKRHEGSLPKVKSHYYYLYVFEKEYYLEAIDNPDEHLIPQLLSAIR